MRALGIILACGGSAATVWCTIAASHKRRPFDLLAAVGAPVALALALLGGVLVFVPGFLR